MSTNPKINKELEQAWLKEYDVQYQLAEKEIQKHMDICRGALNKAIEVSEKYGVAYYFGVSPLSQQYIPDSYSIKWSEEQREILSENDIVCCDYYGTGWEHSAVC